jgi:hypothetical protein
MAIGIKDTIANAWLNGLCRNVAWTQPAAFSVNLHTADPGAARTTAPAGTTTRQQETYSAASAGSCTTSAEINWTNVSRAETYSHDSFWDASTAGTFLGSDDLAVSRTVAVGDNFTITAGQLTVAITPLAA